MGAGLRIGSIAALALAATAYGDSPAPTSSALSPENPAAIPSDADAWRKVPYHWAPSTKEAKPVEDPQPFVSQRLPVYLVVGSHVLINRGHNLATDKEKAAVVFQEHPGLVVGNVFGLNAAQAPEILRREDWEAAKSDYEDLAHDLALGGDPGEGRFIVKTIQDEDLQVRAEDEKSSITQVGDDFRVGQLQANSRLIQAPDIPIDFPVVQMKW